MANLPSDPDDPNELRTAIVIDREHACIRLVFGVPVGWVSLSAEGAREMAGLLLKQADTLDKLKA